MLVAKPEQPIDLQSTTTRRLERIDLQSLLAIFTFALGGILGAGAIWMFSKTAALPPDDNSYSSFLILSVAFTLAALLILASQSSILNNRPAIRLFILIISVQSVLALLGLLVDDIGILSALLAMIFTAIIGFASLNRGYGDTAITIGIFGAIVILVLSLLITTTKVDIPEFLVFIPALLGLLVMIYLVMMAMEFIVATLRVKLVSASLALALIPLALLSITQSQFTRDSLYQQNYDGLNLAAQKTANEVDEFITNTLNTVALNANMPAFPAYLNMDSEMRPGSDEEADIQTVFQAMRNSPNSSYILSIGIINNAGRNIFDTKQDLIGLSEGSTDYFVTSYQSGRGYNSPVLFDRNNVSYMIFSSPILGRSGSPIGVLRMKYSAQIFQRLIESNRGLFGYRSYPILFDENFIRLADASNPGLIYKPVNELTIPERNRYILTQRLPLDSLPDEEGIIREMETALLNAYTNPDFTYQQETSEVETAGSVIHAREMPWYVVYIQRQDFLTSLLQEQGRLSLLVSTLIASIAALASMTISRVLSQPITQLTHTATQVTSGDLNAKAEIRSNDEIGTLGEAFNEMTRQVSTLVNELEDRVQARTQELYRQNLSLQYRTQQLQTVSDVARSITTAQQLDYLLDQVTGLISERFNFYHVGIFLLDELGEFAVLRAANSEGGKRMLARQHRLKVGQVGIVGYATGVGEPRIATDVGEDSVYFNNPDLPLTRSEMALPLKTGEVIIGALDVQSTTANAFSTEDIELFSILADQVAVAIMNNRLYEETTQALAEVQDLHRQYLRQEWQRESSERARKSYMYTPQGTIAIDEVRRPEIEKAFASGEVVENTSIEPDAPDSTVAVPILLRGEPIGVIHMQEKEKSRTWNEEELAAIQSVADQIALAMENVRLLQETTRRSERDRKVLEITSKIRSTNDLGEMLSVAVEELQRSLNATRAQVILSPGQTTSEKRDEHVSGNGNGSNGHHGGEEAVE